MKSSFWQGNETWGEIRILVVNCNPNLNCTLDDGKTAVDKASDEMVMGAVQVLCELSLLVSQQKYFALLHATSVSNRSKFLGWFRVRFHPKPDYGNRSYHPKNLDHWKWASFTTINPAVQVHNFCLQLSIWVLIVRWHDQYIHYAVVAARSPPAVRFAIGLIFVELLSKTREFCWKYGVISLRFNEYCSDRKSESRRWNTGYNGKIYVLSMAWYDENWNSVLERKLQDP
jgi:hypothetical protein